MRLIVVIIFSLFSFIGIAGTPAGMKIISADSLWRNKGLFSLNMGQTSFTNWAPGGDNNLSLNSILLYDLVYQKDSVSWENHFDLQFGSMIYFDKNPKKTNDKIYFSSKLGYKASKNWNYSLYYSLGSQFINGYKYPNDSVPISRFMAPAYLMMGLGMDYKPNKNISILLSPFTNKITIVNDDDLAAKGAFGMEPAELDTSGNVLVPAKKFKSEPGGFIKFYFQQQFNDDLKFSTRLALFAPYYRKPINLDVRWNIFSSYQITKGLAITFVIDLVYDEEAIIKEDVDGDGVDEIVGPRTQVKESLGIGLSYKW